MKRFQVLGKFYLPDHQAHRNFALTEDYYNPLNDILGIGLLANWTYRSPARNAQVARQNEGRHNDGWHPDGGGKTGILFWSNEYPTEVRSRKGYKSYVSEPNDVILIDNGAALHRVPLDYIQAINDGMPNTRYFIRCILRKYPSPKQIHEWRDKLIKAVRL